VKPASDQRPVEQERTTLTGIDGEAIKYVCVMGMTTAALLVFNAAGVSAQCGDTGVWLQVIGSGNPGGLGRASAGCMAWIDGVSRIMVDTGGGTFARFHEAGAQVSDLQLLALSHFYSDTPQRSLRCYGRNPRPLRIAELSCVKKCIPGDSRTPAYR